MMAFDSTAGGRARRVFALLLVLLGLLIGRTGWLQLVCGEEYAARASRQHFTSVETPAPRGRILDRHGRALALCYHACSVTVDPVAVDDPVRFATRLALALGEPGEATALAGRVAAARDAGRRFLYVRRRVDREVAARVRAEGLCGVHLLEEPRREYPHGTAAAAVVGVVADARGGLEGRTGLERRFDRELRGRPGTRTVFRTARQQRLFIFPERRREPEAGQDVRTTIDVAIQQLAERALDDLGERWDPAWSCAVAMDPWTGELLALANRPRLDLDDFDPASLAVRAAEYAYEPGSTIKPLIAAWALTRGAVRTDEIIDCGPGWKRFGGRVLHDVRPNGPLDLQHVLIKSSNCGMATVGQAVGMEGLYELLTGLGFGTRTGVELPIETRGQVTAWPDWKRNYTDVSVSMGHELQVSALQLLRAYAALVNGGRLVRPTLLAAAPAGREPVPTIAFAPEARRFALATMERVVAEGTGRRARIEGVRIGGKTGTSEGYRENRGRYTSSFLAVAPLDDPRVLVLVVAHHPESGDGTRPYGGTVAAPAVRDILRGALPLLPARPHPPSTYSESGVRPETQNTGKVRVAAVKDSSVSVGERISPASGRNPDSGDVDFEGCRSGGAAWRR